MASLDRLPSGRFRVRYNIRASEARRTRTFPSLEEAEAFKAAIEQRTNESHDETLFASKSLLKQTPRFDDFVLIWFKNHAPLIKPSTAYKYGATINKLLIPEFGTLPLDQITAPVIRGWQAQLVNQGRSPRTIRIARTLLSMVLKTAVADGLIPVNPMQAVRIQAPKIIKEKIRPLTEDELRLLNDSMAERFRALVLLGGYCGLRIGELLALRVDDIDLDTSEVRVERTLTTNHLGQLQVGRAKTENSMRTVTMPKVAHLAVQHHLASGFDGVDGSLFSGKIKRQQVKYCVFYQHPWRKAIERSGLTGITPHDLRHTAVSLWIRAGASPKLVAARAGHSSVQFVFDTYGHLFDDEDADLAAKLGHGWDS